MTNYNYEDYKKSADYILERIGQKPEIAMILGSALGSLAEELEDKIVIKYSEIPNFLVSTVSMHASELIFGKLAGKQVVVMSGRFHYYEGYSFEQLAIPIRVLKLLGVKTTIVTNASGAVNADYNVGDIMVMKDHIKLMGASPMRGPNIDEFGPRFFDAGNIYTKELRELATSVANKLGQDDTTREGVYFYAPGPQFETPSEIHAMRILGGDVVGMSTVTETLTAAHCGMKILGLSLVTNMAAGILDQPLTEEEVKETGIEAAGRFKKLIKEIVSNI